MSCVPYSDLATLLSKHNDDIIPPCSEVNPSHGEVVRTMREFPDRHDGGLGYNVIKHNDHNGTHLCISNIGHPGGAPPCELAQFITHMHPSPPPPVHSSPPIPPPIHSSPPKKFECRCNLINGMSIKEPR